MSALAVLAAAGVAAGAAGVAAIAWPPTTRLAPRVRPYATTARSALGLRDAARPAGGAAAGGAPAGPALARLFGPPLVAAVRRLAGVIDRRGDDELERLLRRAGSPDVTPEDHRVRQVAEAAAGGAVSAAATGLLLHTPVVVLGAGVAGALFGSTRARARLDRAVAARAARIRAELYTVNHLLAMHVRTGAGPLQAVQRLTDRGRGAVAAELREVLAWVRAGTNEAAAFRRAADLTPEPSAARTYRLLATGAERGVDLGAAFLALSTDLRDARREQLHKDAVRRRAAMLVPTIGILAPIMLLFIAAPLPSIVLGRR